MRHVGDIGFPVDWGNLPGPDEDDQEPVLVQPGVELYTVERPEPADISRLHEAPRDMADIQERRVII